MTRWDLLCNNCDHEWSVELDEFEHPDDVDARCPECGSDDHEAMLPRMLS